MRQEKVIPLNRPSAAPEHCLSVPAVDSEAYCLEITGDTMRPVYREGDIGIVSPEAAVRDGDKVIVKTTDGNVVARILVSQGVRVVVLAPLDPMKPEYQVDRADIEWMARIVWATQ